MKIFLVLFTEVFLDTVVEHLNHSSKKLICRETCSGPSDQQNYKTILYKGSGPKLSKVHGHFFCVGLTSLELLLADIITLVLFFSNLDHPTLTGAFCLLSRRR